MPGGERLCGREHLTRILNNRPERTVGGEPFEDRRYSLLVERAFGHTAPQGAPYLERKNGRRHAVVSAEQSQDLAATRLVDVAFDEGARIEIRPGHG